MKSYAKIWEEQVIIPTYPVGKEEKNPIFLEKRVYQGSCGKVYPYPTIETISDEKVDQEYTAIFLENEYIKIEILPELGGRVQRAYDKTNDYDFVYYNQVIKPALVGILGPWISGGIEFNWPQHHRPTTFMPVIYEVKEYEDGSVALITHDTDRMYGTSETTEFRVYPGKAYLEITGKLYNGTDLPQTFLWWANPAVAVNDNTQSIFPPDVHAVMDHGKRDVSDFPIAHGTYYKHDYSAGVDISRYKNIPVPTSYMAEKSNYDFVGGYDYGVGAGLLHVADHHVSPGKKQWTWGNGDFGQAWDRNLTDEDGPYIELMTGMFTDNQPDFTWIEPHEGKEFTQYFMPYKTVGQVKNATKDVVVGLDMKDGEVVVRAYASGTIKKARLVLEENGITLWEKVADLSPVDTLEEKVTVVAVCANDVMPKYPTLSVCDNNGKLLISYTKEKEETPEMPSPAEAIGEPGSIPTNEELLYAGKHLEQYRHATYLPDPYYLEGLARDPMDSRINTAYGQLLMRRGQLIEAEEYFRTAIKRITKRNPNPFDSEAFYMLGLCLFLQGRRDEAYDSFYKATWKGEWQQVSFYYMACIKCGQGAYEKALEHVENSICRNTKDEKALGLKNYILTKLGCNELVEESPFAACVFTDADALERARLFMDFGAYDEALAVLSSDFDEPKSVLNLMYQAYCSKLLNNEAVAKASLDIAKNADVSYCFPNNIRDIEVLSWAAENTDNGTAEYLLGNLFYDKLQWEKSLILWETAVAKNTKIPTVYRNLSLVYYNKQKLADQAKAAIEKAFAMDETDARVFMERDQLYKKLGVFSKERLAGLESHSELLPVRDDLYVEYITVLNDCGLYEKAYELISNHHFHPWEGGEGKITGQYMRCLKALAAKAKAQGNLLEAKELLTKAFTFPHNLGEGKLEGQKDNDLHFLLGEVCELIGEADEARAHFEAALLGMGEIGMSMYYNDQPVDMVLYQALASIKLGDRQTATSICEKLEATGNAHMNDEVKIEYFAVSLPDFLIYEDDMNLRNKAHCQHMIELADQIKEALRG